MPQSRLLPSSVSSLPGMAAPDLSGVTRPNRRRCDETESLPTAQDPAHSPCSRSHARPAGSVAMAAGGLLPHRFAPYQHRDGTGGNAFCCGCSQDSALAGLPPLAVSWGDLALLKPPENRTGSREVPLGSRTNTTVCRYPVTAHPSIQHDYTMRRGGHQVSDLPVPRHHGDTGPRHPVQNCHALGYAV